MRILVTGGAGYVGSVVVAALTAAGHEPVVLDSLDRGQRAAVGSAPLVEGDIRDADLVVSTLTDQAIGCVIHLAGLKSPAESLQQPGRYFDVNVGGSRVLFDAMTAAGVTMLVFSSSCAVYGNPPRLPIDEACPTEPTTPYGESKLMVERMLPWYQARGLRSVALRYFNAAGASEDGNLGEDWRDASNLIPVVIRAALERHSPVDVFGTDYPTPDGTAIRDYIHVLDLAAAHVRAVEALAAGTQGQILNLGTGRGSSVAEVLAAVSGVTGEPVPHRLAPRRPGDPPAVWADATRAHAALGWRAERDLDQIVTSAVRWHMRHPNGFRA